MALLKTKTYQPGGMKIPLAISIALLRKEVKDMIKNFLKFLKIAALIVLGAAEILILFSALFYLLK